MTYHYRYLVTLVTDRRHLDASDDYTYFLYVYDVLKND